MAVTEASALWLHENVERRTPSFVEAPGPILKIGDVRVDYGELAIGQFRLPITSSTEVRVSERKPIRWFPVFVIVSGFLLVLFGAARSTEGLGIIAAGLSWMLLASTWIRRTKSEYQVSVGNCTQHVPAFTTKDIEVVSQFQDAVLLARRTEMKKPVQSKRSPQFS
ncbi:MAG TPA: DUF6232 family protein [Terriglobales bacterium]|nr:DUF6232 family protein [Terriglobales bacterium]